ncbi:MAG: hypothetical protein IPG64_19675 [Haliea sp.]|nr:hypothetical protein [Haliea sp.]
MLHDNHQQLIVAAKFRVELLQGTDYCANANEVGRQVLEILDQALEVSRSLTMELAPRFSSARAWSLRCSGWRGGWRRITNCRWKSLGRCR